MTPFSDYSTKAFGYFALFNITKYDQDLCVNICYQDKLIKNCSCAGLDIHAFDNVKYCKTDAEVQCGDDFFSVFTNSNADLFCDNVCKPNCNTQIFQYSISTSKFPTIEYLTNHPKESLTLRSIVNYNDSYYGHISKSAYMTFISLIGDDGDQLGLFAGISLLRFLSFCSI